VSSFVRNFSSTAKFLLLSMFSCVLVACGGGGGGSSGTTTLTVSVVYNQQTIDLFSSTTMQPAFSGFAGHTPSCTLLTGYGPLPPGMTLNSNCSITGIPTAIGSYTFSVRVGASGVGNTIDVGTTVTVQGPSNFYTGHTGFLDGLTVGDTVNDSPSISNWTVPIGLALNWNYQIVSGTLPPGLTLNSSTGLISGVVTTQGTYYANISETLTTSLGTYTTSTTYGANVGVPAFGYFNDGGTGSANLAMAGYVSQPFHATPFTISPNTSFSGFSLVDGPLPAGLNLDVNTGVISGTPTDFYDPAPNFGFHLTATSTRSGLNNPTAGVLTLVVASPVSVGYGLAIPPSPIGLAKTILPMVTTLSPLPLVNPSFSYAPSAFGCSLPSGMTLNTSTGAITGIPTSTGTFNCWIAVTITNNSFSWTQGTQAYFTIN
jgi:hypothetical protein